MIKVYASIASVGFLVLAGAAGCSSASTPEDGDGGSPSKAGTATNTSGSNSPAAGTNGSEGGSSSAGKTSSDAGSSTAGTPSGGTGSGGTAPGGAACKSIKTGMACMPAGTDCPDLKCGIADSGTRACMCDGTWMCSSCDFTDSPFKDRPEDIGTCTTEADKLDCATMGAMCEGAPGGEVCACYPDDEGALIWDCDDAPSSWAAPM